MSVGNELKVWKIDSSKFRRGIHLADTCIDVAFTPDSRSLLAVQPSPRAVLKFDLATRELVGEISHDPIRVIDISRKGTIALGGDDGLMTLQKPGPEGNLVVRAHSEAIWQIAFASTGDRVATFGLDDAIKVWDTDSGKMVRMFRCSSPVTPRIYDTGPLALSPDGKWLASADAERQVLLFDLTSEDPTPHRLWQHKGTVFTVEFSPDGAWLASTSWDGSVCVGDMRADRYTERPRLLRHALWVLAAAFSRDSRTLITSCGDGRLRFGTLKKASSVVHWRPQAWRAWRCHRTA